MLQSSSSALCQRSCCLAQLVVSKLRQTAPVAVQGGPGGQGFLFCPCCLVQHAPPVYAVSLSPCDWCAGVFLVHLPSSSTSLPRGCAPSLHRLTQPLCRCRVAVGGPLIPEGRHPPAFRVATLPSGDSVAWQFTCRVGACARMTVQPYLDLPARAAVIPGERFFVQSHRAEHCAALPVAACARCCHPQ